MCVGCLDEWRASENVRACEEAKGRPGRQLWVVVWSGSVVGKWCGGPGVGHQWAFGGYGG